MTRRVDTCEFVDEAAVRAILLQKRVNTFFQPVVSIPAKAVVGFETFSRPTGQDCNLDTRMLFHAGLEPELMVKMDQLCRGMALKRFKPFHDSHNGMLLFLKVNPEVFAHIEVGQSMLARQLAEVGISPASVVLEFSSRLPHADRVMPFIEMYREIGVKIGLDGCSAGDAFALVINQLRPDFVKVNDTFFGDDARVENASRILETLFFAAERVGSLVIAQNVETEDESIRLLAAGVHLQQGYYYSKDEDAVDVDHAATLKQKIQAVKDKYKGIRKELVRRKKERFAEAFKGVGFVCSKLESLAEEDFEAGCKVLLEKRPEILSVFILDVEGRQTTSRVHACVSGGLAKTDVVMGTSKGTDHSAQDYVLYLDMGYLQFVTKPFISAYGGGTACLISKPFYDRLGGRYTLCLEIPYPG